MRWLRLLPAVVTGALVVLIAAAGPAAADSAGPGDYTSEVTGIVPAKDGVHADIQGGDAFLEVTVDEGHTVIVEGYTGEPYLRFLPDGTIERNRLSSATYLNENRKAKVDIPAAVTEAGPDAEPQWETIGSGGSYAWHDHRVHWMQDSSPNVERGEAVGGAYAPWKVPIVVDGSQADIEGTLVYEHTVSPLPYLGTAVLVAGLLGYYGRRGGLRLTAILLAAVSAAALWVGWADYASTPGGGNPLHWALAAGALVAAVLAAALARRAAGVVLTLASAASLSGWGLFRIEVLFKPVLPTDLPYALDRTVVALALGVSVGAAIVAVLSSGVALPTLADDEPAPAAG
ncbi:MAG: hypothetical protein ACJ739_07880 [Acidimicrobiales bacterium]